MALQNFVTQSVIATVNLGYKNDLDTAIQEIDEGSVSKQIGVSEIYRGTPGNIKHPAG